MTPGLEDITVAELRQALAGLVEAADADHDKRTGYADPRPDLCKLCAALARAREVLGE